MTLSFECDLPSCEHRGPTCPAVRAFDEHALAAVSEGMCPYGHGRLSASPPIGACPPCCGIYSIPAPGVVAWDLYDPPRFLGPYHRSSPA